MRSGWILIAAATTAGCISDIAYTDEGDLYILKCHEEADLLLGFESPASASRPLWSPDAKWLAYRYSAPRPGVTSSLRTESQLEVVDSRGERRTNLTRASIDNGISDFDWAPNSDDLAFVAGIRLGGAGGANQQVWKVSVSEGPSSTRLISTRPEYADRDPDWAPDGLRIAVSSHQASDPSVIEIATINGDGTGRRTLASHAFSLADVDPTWSPDGRLIVFNRLVPGSEDESGTFTMNRDGSNLRRIWSRTLDNPLGGGYEWSPDGTHLAFPCYPDLCVIGYDVEDDRFSTEVHILRGRSGSFSEQHHYALGNFSPDRGRLLVYSQRDNATGADGIRWWDRNTRELRELSTSGNNPRWKPAGLRFCLFS